jgi:2-(1,2-epoxy-1,2-dihydrophenyl)acetyl-CoA isomerase
LKEWRAQVGTVQKRSQPPLIVPILANHREGTIAMRKDFERAYVTQHGNVAVLTLNHPEVMNAASLTLVQGAAQASGGAPQGVGHSLETVYHPFLRRLRDCRMPVITAVNGPAAGVGMSLALMGDLVIAARSAYFLQAFARIGLVPDGGSTWLLPRLVGLARAKELSLLAERLPAETALQWGLINRVVDDAALMSEALKLAERLANGPTLALATARKLYWESPVNTYEEQLDLERRSQEQAGRTEDFVEGVAAFLQKREAKFKGR